MTVSEKLRLVQGLHSHAEIFGFNWDDGSDWTWHDVACKIADEVDVENAKLRELVRALLTCATNGECDECRMNGAAPWHVGEAQLCDGIWEHLRELGVEVDG